MQRKMQTSIFRVVASLLLLSATSIGQSFNFVSIDVPCSAAPPSSCPNGISRRTALGGINPAGDIVGTYNDSVGKQHGFVLNGAQFAPTDVPGTLVLSGGQFKTIDFPGFLVGVSGTLPTIARGIGPSGDIVGQFTAPYNPPLSTIESAIDSANYCPAIGSAACIKGFLYHPRSNRFSAVMFPGHPGAIPGVIAPDNSMYGCYHDYDTMASMFSAAWVRTGDTFTYTSLAAGGDELSDPNKSCANSMHGGATPDGTILVGFCVDMTVAPNHTHGYVLQNGILQNYDVPSSTATTVWDITPGRELVGTYIDISGRQHGFIQSPDGSAPIAVDAPTTAPFNAVRTVFQGINPGGTMVGQYTDTSGHTHGLLAVPVSPN